MDECVVVGEREKGERCRRVHQLHEGARQSRDMDSSVRLLVAPATVAPAAVLSNLSIACECVLA